MSNSGDSTPKNNDSLEESPGIEPNLTNIEQNIRQLQADVQGVSLDSIRTILSYDPEAANDAIMGDGDPHSAPLFTMTTPRSKSVPLAIASTSKPLPSPGPEKWYPCRFDQTEEGKKCNEYLFFLRRAMKSEYEALRQLSYAEQLVPYIGCSKSMELWTILGPLLTQVSNLKLHEVACDLAGYMYSEPDYVAPYIKCLNRLKPFLTRTSEKFFDLEERSTQLVSLFDTTIASAVCHQDETIKFASQVSNVSSSLAGLQEVLERTMIKVKKLDLLPDVGTHIPSAISVPSLSVRTPGSRVVLIDFGVSGEYTGIYTLRIENHKIKSLIPPRNSPEITAIVDLPQPAQEVFVNLNQAEILNRLANKPEYRKAFTAPTLKERGPLLRELCKGISKRTNQWIKSDYEASSS